MSGNTESTWVILSEAMHEIDSTNARSEMYTRGIISDAVRVVGGWGTEGRSAIGDRVVEAVAGAEEGEGTR